MPFPILFLALLPAPAQTGGEAPPPVVGKVLDVRAENVTLDKGSGAGVAPGAQFDVFSNPVIIRIPGTDQEAFSESRVIARVLVTEVKPDRSSGSIFETLDPGTPVVAGLRVVRSGILVPLNVPPQIKGARLKPEQPRWGDVVEIELEVVDVEKDVVDYRWDAAAGPFLDAPPLRWEAKGEGAADVPLSGAQQAVTLAPKIRWLCPREAGEVVCTVVARDAGRKSGTLQFKISAGGKPDAAALERLAPEGIYAGMARHFVRADDLAFDADGRAYVLDTNTQKVICLNPDFSMAWATNPYDPAWRPRRIAVTGDRLLLLDARARDVKEFRARREMFDGPPERIHGAAGGRGIRLRRPVAMTLGAQGDVYVADAELGIVQRFDREGASQVQIGSKGEGRGQLQDVADIAVTAPDLLWILDRARQKVVVYAGLRLRGELDAVGSGDAPVALGTSGTRVFVLGEQRLWALDPDTGPRPLGSPVRRQFWSLAGARKIAGDPFGYLYVTGVEGESILRFDGAGAFRGQWGGADFSTAYRLAVNDGGAMALLSWQPGVVWKLDRQGWITDVMSTGEMQVYDLALTAGGALWLLDASKNRLVQASTGPRDITEIPLSRQRITGAVALAAAGDKLHVLDRRGQNLWVHTVDTSGGGAEGARLLVGSRIQDGHRLVVEPDGRCWVWGAGNQCKVFDPEGNALPALTFPVGGMAGARPGTDGTVFALEAADPSIWLAYPGGERPLRFSGEGIFSSPIDLAGDGFRRLYVLDGANGRVVRLGP